MAVSKYLFIPIKILCLLLFLISCTPMSSATDIPTATAKATIDSVTATSNLPTATSSSTFNAKTVLNANIIQYCPAKQDVEVNKLGVDPSIGLLVKNIEGEDVAYWILSLIDSSLTQIPIMHTLSGSLYNFTGISFDNKWLTYVTKDDNEENYLLVTDLKGNEKWEWPVPVEEYSYFTWTKNNQIVFWGQDGIPGRENRDVPIAIIDPFTGNNHTYNKLSIPSDGIIMLWSDNSNSSNVIYYYPYHLDQATSLYRDSFVLYNLETDSSKDFIPWMDEMIALREDFNLSLIYLVEDQNNYFSLVYSKPYGFDFVDGLTVDEAADGKIYEQTMQPVLLEEGQPDIYVVDFSGEEHRFYFVRFDKSDYQSPLPETLYFYDMENNILGDYCIDLGFTGFYLRSYLSPDNRFLAWSDFGMDARDVPIGTAILDTTTGKIAKLQDYEAVGWVVLKQ